jgi:DNA-binding NtrC family response regulator
MYTESDSNRIFVVEDNPQYARFLQYVISLNPSYEVKVFYSGRELLENLQQEPDIITLDYSLPDTTGEELIGRIKSRLPQTHVIIISAQEDISTAVQLLKLGAYDYITKDEDTKNRLHNSIQNAGRNIALVKEVNLLKQEISRKYEFSKTIIGNSPAIKKVFGLMEKAVKTNITVSISGETGTGKEVVAKAIHYNSERRKQPFVAVNIAAIPKDLIESELFGHEKGAFTGAVTRRIGKFEEANQGTIFLDEIGEMDLSLQAKLLRVIQEKELVRIGGSQLVKLDVRIIVATHRDLKEEVKAGRFREDLYYRLLGLPVHLPPLRERGNDILLLARHLIQAFCQDNQLRLPTLSPPARKKLLGYQFPGNVRELKSLMELAVVMAEDEVIDAEHIQFNSVQKEEQFLNEELSLREYNLRIIRHFLQKYDHNVLLVADKLQIGKSTIYRYLKEIETLSEAPNSPQYE